MHTKEPKNSMVSKVIVTGASGLLGKAVVKAFQGTDWEVHGIGFSRAEQNDLRKCDLKDETAMRSLLQEVKPDVIIHCAGLGTHLTEKYPELAQEMNVTVTENLAKASREIGSWLLYISTDNVFDGKNPSYATNAETNPLNVFGKTKRDGELMLWKNQPDGGVLRVPLLYGNVEHLDDSEVSGLANIIFSGQATSLDNVQIRFPTFVDDVAQCCRELAERKIEHCGLYGTWHWSGTQSFTTYTLALAIAKILKVSSDHIKPLEVVDISKPHNAELNCVALRHMRIGKHTPLQDSLQSTFKSFIST